MFKYTPIKYEIGGLSPLLEHERCKAVESIIKHVDKILNAEKIVINHRKKSDTRIQLLVSEYIFSFFSAKVTSHVDAIIPYNNIDDTVIPNFLRNICTWNDGKIPNVKIVAVIRKLNLVKLCADLIRKLRAVTLSTDGVTVTDHSKGYTYKYSHPTRQYKFDIPTTLHNILKSRFSESSGVSFNVVVMCVLMRYNSLGSLNHQLAMPYTIREAFRKKTGVNHECFASALNAYYDTYCSLFYDIEKYLGSCGPMQNMKILSGVYMANPPYEDKILQQLVDKVKESENPSVSFIFGMPKWDVYKDQPFKPLVDSLALCPKQNFIVKDYTIAWYNVITTTSSKIPASYVFVVGSPDLFETTRELYDTWAKQ